MCSRIALNRTTNNAHLDIDNTRVRRCIRCINSVPYLSLKNWHPPLEFKRTTGRHDVTDSLQGGSEPHHEGSKLEPDDTNIGKYGPPVQACLGAYALKDHC